MSTNFEEEILIAPVNAAAENEETDNLEEDLELPFEDEDDEDFDDEEFVDEDDEDA